MAVICPDCQNENTEDSVFCKTCGTSIEPAAILSSLTKTIIAPQGLPGGEKLFAGRYHFLSTLGRGGRTLPKIFRALAGCRPRLTGNDGCEREGAHLVKRNQFVV